MTIDATPAGLRLVDVNLAATVEQGCVGTDPYRIDADGAPYVPVGDGGIVLGVRLGDDHVAPGPAIVETPRDGGVIMSALAQRTTIEIDAVARHFVGLHVHQERPSLTRQFHH